MNKQIKALKMAIAQMRVYAMQHENEWMIKDAELEEAIKACKEALAEAEKQEPVAWLWLQHGKPKSAFIQKPSVDTDGYWKAKGFSCDPLYTHPATWQSLSDDEICDLWTESSDDVKGCIRLGYTTQQHYFASLIEQALKEKNHE